MSDYLQVPKIMPPLQVIHFSAAGNLIPQLNVHHIPQFVNPPLPLKTVVSVFWFFVSAGLRVQTTTLFFLVADALSGPLTIWKPVNPPFKPGNFFTTAPDNPLTSVLGDS